MIAVFLDIDGVLNRRADDVLFNPECVRILSRIVAVLGPDVVMVLSSWHRRSFDATGATKRLRKAGYVGPAIRHVTPILGDGAQLRDKEILTWLDYWLDITHVLVLDDDYEAGEGPLRAHHVMPTDGLHESHIGEAITRAGAPWRSK